MIRAVFLHSQALIIGLLLATTACAHAPRAPGRWEAQAEQDGAPPVMVDNARACDEEDGLLCAKLGGWYASRNNDQLALELFQIACNLGGPGSSVVCGTVEQYKQRLQQK